VNTEDVGVVFIYFNYKDPQPALEILGSFLKQLVSRKTSIPAQIQEVYQRHIKQGTRPTVTEVTELLQAEAQTLTTLFIVLDALDECTETNYCRVKILLEIRKLGSNLRILVTGQEHVESILLESFPGAKRMEIRASDEDIRKFVDGRIEIEQNMKRYIGQDAKLRGSIVTTITKKVEGM